MSTRSKRQSCSLVFEFQVIARELGGKIEELKVEAETAEEAEARAREVLGDPKAAKISVGPGRPVIDWQKPVYTMQEASCFLSCSYSQISALMDAGALPKALDGSPRFRKEWLLRVVNERMQMKEAA